MLNLNSRNKCSTSVGQLIVWTTSELDASPVVTFRNMWRATVRQLRGNSTTSAKIDLSKTAALVKIGASQICPLISQRPRNNANSRKRLCVCRLFEKEHQLVVSSLEFGQIPVPPMLLLGPLGPDISRFPDHVEYKRPANWGLKPWFGRHSVKPAWHDEGGLAMLLLGREVSHVPKRSLSVCKSGGAKQQHGVSSFGFG